MKLFVLVLLLVVSINLANSVEAACSPFAFPNGSTVSFANASQFVGWFPQMAQSGGGNYDWSMSLCDATIQATGAPPCANGNNMVQTSSCDVVVAGNPTISAMADGTGVVLSFAPAKQFDNNIWANTINCVCDPTKNNLNSPSNSYAVTVNLPNIGATWYMSSNGCCIDNSFNTTTTTSVSTETTVAPNTTAYPTSTTASTPLPPAPGSHCAPLLLPNGSLISFSNSAALSGDFKQMFQANAGSLHDWSFSLCYPTQQSSAAPSCAAGTYMAESSTCKLKIPDPANISLTSDGNGVIFAFPGALQTDGDTWHPTVTCICNRSATASLYSTYNGYWTMWQNGQVTALWTLSSAGCCFDLPTTTTAPTTSTYPVPTPAPTTTTTAAPITGNQCKKVTFANGSYVPFTNYKKLTGFFPSIQQYGINPHTTSWSLSLCDPSIVAPSGNGQVCNPHSYLSENGCETIFPQLSFQTRDQNLEVGFTYIRRVNATVSHYAYIYCACDPTAQNELKVPSNSYNVFSDPTGDLIQMWRVSSVECCAINPNRSTTTTTTTTFVPSNASSSTTRWVVPNNTDSTMTSTETTTTPAPSGSNNNNNSPGGDNNGNGTSDVKVFGFAAAGAAAGVIIVGCLFFFVRWICTRKTNNSVDAYRSAYEHPLNEHTP